jgi:hypothetical protein
MIGSRLGVALRYKCLLIVFIPNLGVMAREGLQRISLSCRNCCTERRLTATTWQLVEIKAQFNAPSLGSAERESDPPRGVAMLRTITKNMFDVVVGLTIIAAVFYLAVITHIVPLPENALERLAEVSVDIMDVVVACGAWLASFLP